MTRTQLQPIMPLLKSFCDGETLQARVLGNWKDIDDPIFEQMVNGPDRWRVKPKPREIYAIEQQDGRLHGAYRNKEDMRVVYPGERVVVFVEDLTR